MPENTNKPAKRGRTWKPLYDRVLELLLQGKSQKQVAAELGISDGWVSKLTRWSTFSRKMRLRRAAQIEASDGIMAAADSMASMVLIRAMQLVEPTTREVIGKNGETKIKNVPADVPVALSAARIVKQMNRERVADDVVYTRVEEIEAKLKKRKMLNED